MSNSINLHWQYFHALDEDLAATLRFVELHKKNFKTFSIEYIRLLFSICSEFEVICKQLCTAKFPDRPFTESDMETLSDSLLEAFPKIHSIEINVRRLNIQIQPLKDWNESYKKDEKDFRRMPFWWQDYNHVKHARHSNYHRANLKSVLCLVCFSIGLGLNQKLDF